MFGLELQYPIKRIAFKCSSINFVQWVVQWFACIHNLFKTLMPYQQQISSVLETQHQVSSGKIQQVFFLVFPFNKSFACKSTGTPTVAQLAHHQRYNQMDSKTEKYHSLFCQGLKIKVDFLVIVAQNAFKQRK